MALNEVGAEAKPRWGGRWRWLAVMAVVSVLLVQGMLAANQILSQVNVGNAPPSTIVLPTVGPTSHQITPAEYAALIVQQMSLSDEIAQMLMIDLTDYRLVPDQQKMIQQQHVGGALFFSSDIATGPQVQQFTSAMQQVAPIKLFIAVDQEGGTQVNRLANIVGARPGEPDIGQRDDPAYARAAGAQTADDLEHYGFNMNLAPVVDIQEPDVQNTGLGGRLYSSDPNVIANMANDYLQGLQHDGKVIGTLKHFPGLGSSAVNPDRNLPVVNRSQAQLDAHEFVPYRELIKDGNVRAIMVTHILLPQIDDTNPATLSSKVITGLLRGDLGYKGLIVTDDLRRVLPYTGLDIGQASLESIQAGADILMGPLFSDDVTTIETTVTNAIAGGQLTKARIDQSVQRILTQKIEMGLIKLPRKQVKSTPTPKPGHHPTDVPGTTTPVAFTERR